MRYSSPMASATGALIEMFLTLPIALTASNNTLLNVIIRSFSISSINMKMKPYKSSLTESIVELSSKITLREARRLSQINYYLRLSKKNL